MGTDGNGHKENKEMQDILIKDVDSDEETKLLVAGMQQQPLFSHVPDGSNLGLKLIEADIELGEMLKLLNINDRDEALDVAAGLGECAIFLFDENNKPRPRVLRIINSIRTKLSLECSVKGWMVDQYKQTATKVVTSTMVDGKGYVPIIPTAHTAPEQYGENGKRKDRERGRRP